MEKNYVEIQGRFSSDGRFVGGNYVPEVIDRLMDDAYSTISKEDGLCRLRVTVEVESLGAEIKFGNPMQEKPAVEPQVLPVPQCVTAGKLTPAQGIDPAPEVVA